ncbi:MAG: AAA family ATPase [Haloferacaceae archaeon]
MGDLHGTETGAGASTGESTTDGRVVAVCGVPGVGKTTVAEWIAENHGGELLRSDLVRKELFPEPSYTEAERRRTYATLFDRGLAVAERGRTAVLDATFARRRYRDQLIERAGERGVDVEFVAVDCAEPVVRERIATREGASDADFEVYLYYRYRFDPVRRPHLAVDNSGELAETYAQLERHFGDAGEITVGDGRHEREVGGASEAE